ncbi:MAG: tetratricopeptide repeat protein [Cyanobacteria bacterium P01_C01_bin.89]
MVTQSKPIADSVASVVAGRAKPALWLRLGNRWQRRGQIEPAIAAFQKYCQAFPEDDYGWWRLGQGHDLLNQRPEAIAAYQKMTDLRPDHRDGWIALMTVAMAAKEYKIADQACRRSLALGWDDVRSLKRMGQKWERRGKDYLARSCYQRWLMLDPDNTAAYRATVAMEALTGQWDNVEQLGMAWRSLDNKDPEPWMYLALSYRERDRVPRALECWRQGERLTMALAEEKRPSVDWDEVDLWMTFCLEQRDDHSLRVALEQYQLILQRETPKGAKPYQRLGRLYEKTKQWSKAIAAYDQGIEIIKRRSKGSADGETRTANWYAWLGRCNDQVGNSKDAQEAYERAINQGCAYPWARERYVEECYAQKRWRQAAKAFDYLYGYRRFYDGGDAQKAGDEISEVSQFAEVSLEVSEVPAAVLEKWGRSHWKSGNLDRAIALYRQWTERDPENTQGWLDLGLIYGELGDEDAALDSWAEGYCHGSNGELAWQMAQIYRRRGQLETAVTYYQDCVSAQVHEEQIYGFLGDCFFALQRWALASEAYSQALAYGTNHPPERYYQLGLAFVKQGRPMEAVAAYRRVLEKQPDNFELSMELADVYTELGWSAIAAKTYQDAIASGRSSATIYLKLGSVLRDQEKWSEAALAYGRAIALAPQRSDLRAALAKIYDKQGAIADAIDTYKEALVLDPKPTWVWTRLAELYVKDEDWYGVVTTYAAAIVHHPQLLHQCHEAWAKGYRELGQLENNVTLYEQAVEQFPQKLEFYEALVDAQEALRRWNDGVKTWQLAIAQVPGGDNPSIQFNLAQAYGKGKKWDKALKLCDRLLAEKSVTGTTQGNVYALQGDAYQSARQHNRAQDAYEMALEVGVSDPCSVYINLGQLAEARFKWSDALAAYQKAAEASPKSRKAWQLLATLAQFQNAWEQCAIAATAALGLGSKDKEIYDCLAQAQLALDQPEEALKTVETGLRRHSKYAPLHEQLGRAYEALGQNWRLSTLPTYHRAIRLSPETSFVSIQRSIAILQDNGRWHECLVFIQDAQKRLPNNRWLTAQYHAAKGHVFRHQQNWDQALGSFIRALQILPDLWQVYDAIAHTLHQANRPVPTGSATSPSTFCELPADLIEQFCPVTDGQMATAHEHAHKHAQSPHAITLFEQHEGITHTLASSGTIDGPPLPEITYTTLTTPAAYTALVPKGRVWAGQLMCAVFAGDDTLISDLTTGYGALAVNALDPPIVQEVEGSVAFLATRWSDISYFHWMFDVVPRLGVLLQSGITWNDISHFAFNRCRESFHVATTTALGIPDDKLMQCRAMPWSGSLFPLNRRFPHFRADQLLVPSIPELRCYRSAPWAYQFLRDLFLTENLAIAPTGAQKQCQGNKLYLHRRGAKYRQVVNGEALADLLDKRDFEAFDPGQFTVQEQAKTFAAADVVVAVHGAALTNLVFCKPGTIVVEIFGPNHVQNTYWIISSIAGLKHYHLAATAVPSLEKTRGVKEDLSIDLPQLERLLDSLNL